MKTKQTKQRVFPREIKPLDSDAPWYILKIATKESGVPISTIKEVGIPIKRIGRADYVRTKALNDWIIKDEDPTQDQKDDGH